MIDFVEYIVSELKSKRLSKQDAIALVKQFSVRSSTSDQPFKIHPLLHVNSSDLSRQTYSTVLTGEEFFLQDHQINAQKILPAVAYLEMARAAIEDAIPVKLDLSTIEMRNVVWAQPIVVEEQTRVNISLMLNNEDIDYDTQIDFEIYSVDAENDVIHCQGQAIIIRRPELTQVDIPKLKGQMAKGQLDASPVYSTFGKMGAHFGPSHQGIKTIFQGHEQVLSTLTLPSNLESDWEKYTLHPSLMDSALQSAIGLFGELSEIDLQPMLPFALNSLRIIAPFSKEMFAWVRTSSDSQVKDKLKKLDLDLYDVEGNLCVQMKGYSARIVTNDKETKPINNNDQHYGTLLTTPAWHQTEILKSTEKRFEFLEHHILLCEISIVDAVVLESLLPDSKCYQLQGIKRANAAEQFHSYAVACFEKLQTIIKSKPQGKVFVQIVVSDSHKRSMLIGLSGLLHTAMLENPNLLGQLILTDNMTDLVDRLRLEQYRPQDTIIQYLQGNRNILQWQFTQESSESFKNPFKEHGVYLITGGLGGLGILYAKEILQNTAKARVILTGRSNLADSPDKQSMLNELCAIRDDVEYYQLDISKLADVQQCISTILQRYPQINGVLHCAGVTADSYILKKETNDFNQVLKPKVIGTFNLDEAFREIELDFFVLFSSITSSFGNLGQADYAVANGFMDQFAHYRNGLVFAKERHGKTLTINWPLWLEGVMKPDHATLELLLQETGMHPMKTASGLQAFYRALTLPDSQVMVLAGDLLKIKAFIANPKKETEIVLTQQVATTVGSASSYSEGIVEKTREYLRTQLALVLKLPSHKIDVQDPLEKYGIDSILSMNLTNQLEKTFGSLPKTLFFEYQSIHDLAEYFTRSYPDVLTSLFVKSNHSDNPIKPAIPTSTFKVQTHRRQSTSRPLNQKRKEEIVPVTAIHAEPIAIVGLSGRYPEAVNIQEYWQNLREGKDCITEVPETRWNWKEYYSDDRTKNGHHYSKWGGFISGVDEFDPRFFNISPREAKFIDPQERLFLQHAWAAIEDAGYNRASLRTPYNNDLPGQVGVYVGVMYSEYQLFGAESSMKGTRMSIAGSYASIANRVSYVLDLHGPSMTVDTMCSSSLTAIHLACQDLILRRTHLAIAGGVNVSIHPNKYLFLSAGQFISTDGHCQSFGEGSDGYIPGEGVGVVVLKRLSEAVRDGNLIYGVIKGSAINHGGKTNGYSVPNLNAQASLIGDVLAKSKINPRHISYIEAHGTGTKLGDPIEIAALSKAFQQYTQDFGFCSIGSAKSNIGHCESAAGIAGLTKVLLQMKHRKIVPSLHSNVLNPYIEFQKSPFVVNQKLKDWDQPIIDGSPCPRIAGISAFGAGGSNAHLIVEEYLPPTEENGIRPFMKPDIEVIIPLSARTPEQLKQRAIDLLNFIHSAKPDLPAMAYTLQVGRESMEERVGIIANNINELSGKLSAYIDGRHDIEHIFQGQAKQNNSLVSIINADSDFEQMLNKWLANKKLSKLLELWVNGFDLDWNKLYEQIKPSRISLPTYPFANERYWIDPINGNTSSIIERTPIVLHPLLHKNTSDFSQLAYSSSFTGAEFFLRDCQVDMGDGFKCRVLPAAAILEMARAAVEQASVSQENLGLFSLHNIEWGHPMIIDGGKQIDVTLYANDNSQVDFEIFSKENDQETVHCRGEVSYINKIDATRIDIENLEEQTKLTKINPDEFYQILSTYGFHYGSTYRSIVSINKGIDQVLAKLCLPTDLEAQQNDYKLHPSLLDGALQASIYLMTDFTQPSAYPFFPVTLKELSIINTSSKNMYAWIHYTQDGVSGSPSLDLDIDLCDEQGKLCIQLKGLSFQQVAADLSAPLDIRKSQTMSAILFEPTEAFTTVSKPKALQLVDSQMTETPFTNTILSKPQAIQLSISKNGVAVEEGHLEGFKEPEKHVDELSKTLRDQGITVNLGTFTEIELREQLIISLAESLYLNPTEVDIDKPFVDLGLDSIVGVEWIKVINKTYDLEIAATKVYDYANIRTFASFLYNELQKHTNNVYKQAPETTLVANNIPSPPVLKEKKNLQQWGTFPDLRRISRIKQTTTTPNSKLSTGEKTNKIAIVGMSGRYPQASNMQQYWANLAQGKNSITEIPSSRWNMNDYYDPDPTKEGKMYCKWLGMLDDVDCFDPLFFQITPADAEFMDPQHRIFLEEGYKAFEDAGYANTMLSNTKCGVYLGIMSNDYSYHLSKSTSSSVNITGNSFAIGAARIAYFLNLKGPAIPIDTACSSSLVAIHMACQGLLNHETDMALAGGVSLYLIPEAYVGMCQAGMLSPQGQCKTFDDEANGFVPGEGVGALVLKRLEDAERDKDFIHGVILASGINQDGKTNGITAPSINSQIELERDLYERYDINPETISYVEAHGTGTKLGDPIELEALTTVFKEKTSKKNFCALGSVKSNIGHTSGAAGVASIQKVLLSMQHKTIVPTLNVTKENSIFDLKESPFFISKEKSAWDTNGSPRRAGVSSFGFSGTNAHLVIEEYPQKIKRKQSDVIMAHEVIIPLSARTKEQLKQKVYDLLHFLDYQERSIDLLDIAYTLQIGRDEMKERLAMIVNSIDQLKEKLSLYLNDENDIANTYTGKVIANHLKQDIVGSDDDNDLQKLIGECINKKEFGRLLVLWVKGLTFDWNKLYGNNKPQRISLPAYPFARDRYWIVTDSNETKRAENMPAVDTTEGPEPKEELQKIHYYPAWKEVPLETKPSNGDVLMDGSVLLLGTTKEFYNSLKEELAQSTATDTLIWVTLGNSFHEADSSSFTVNPKQEQDFIELIERLKATNQLPRRIIYPCAELVLSDDNIQPIEQINNNFYVLFYVCKALITCKHHGPLQVLSLFSTKSNSSSPSCAALSGFFKTLSLENPNYKTKLIEIRENSEFPAISTSDQVGIILNELKDQYWRENEIQYNVQRKSPFVRLVRTLNRCDLAPNHFPWRENGVYIISGGLGELGFIFSEYLARNFHARLVLFGRSTLNSILEKRLDQLKAYNAEVIYLQADISKLTEIEAVVEKAKAHFSQINGIIHCAGINKDAFILKKSKEEIDLVLKSKIHGALHLDYATKNENLDVFILFSSVAGVMGNLGQCDYAYANSFLDSFAETRQHMTGRKRSGKTLSINWPYWEEGGMKLGQDELQMAEMQFGVYPLPKKDGIQSLEEFLLSDLSQGVVLYGLPSKVDAYMARKSIETNRDHSYKPNVIDPVAFMERTEAYLKKLVAMEIKLAPNQIDSDERFDFLGIDSIVINRMNIVLEKDLGTLSKTVFYEYSTIRELASYLVKDAQQTLIQLFNLEYPVKESRVDEADKHEMVSKTTNHVEDKQQSDEPIAIIGIHGSYPQSENLSDYWKNLKQGKDLTDLVPASRWNYQEFYSAHPADSAKGKIYCKWGGFIDDVDQFDPHFFNIPPEEARIMDPQERLFLQSVWAAIEDAGYTKESLKEHYPKAKSANVGVFVGVTTNSYNLLTAGEWRQGNASPSAHPWSIANRVSYFFDFNGPSMPIDTACSSSSVAIHFACESLKKQECQVAIAGGVNLYLHPSKYHSLCKNRMVSLGGKCCSYGAGDDGFVPGEGVGSIVLKPLSKAMQDGDHIYAVIAGSAFDHSGRSNGYSAPNPNAQANLISHTMDKFNISPDTISYVEGHGTGTQLGDSLEVVALAKAFGKQEQNQYCPIGSVKANIGHSESAAGIAGLTKILLQMKHRQLAPTIHSDDINPNIDFEETPFYLQHGLAPWKSFPNTPRRALMNSFGAGGVNACIILEEHQRPEIVEKEKAQKTYLIILSAKNEERLQAYVDQLLVYIEDEKNLNLANLSYTLQIGREAMQERLAVIANDRQELLDQLRNWKQQIPSVHIFNRNIRLREVENSSPENVNRDLLDIAFEACDFVHLAEIWINGMEVNWQNLYQENRPQRIPLPTYPFAKERYWIIDMVNQGNKTAYGQRNGHLHPLISYNSSTLNEVSFSSLLSSNEFYALDHQVNQEKIFPGSAFLEIASFSGNMAGDKKVCKLRDVVWAHPLSFEKGPQMVQTFLKPKGEGADYQIVTINDENVRVIHSEGRLLFQNGVKHDFLNETAIPIHTLKEKCLKAQASNQFYDLFRKAGFNYGPAFQTVKEFYINGSFALSKLEIADHLKADFDQFILHPSLLDGALQTVIGLTGHTETETKPYLPFSIEEIEILRPLPPSCYAYATYADSEKQRKSGLKQFNVQLLNEDGLVLIRLSNFYVRSLENS